MITTKMNFSGLTVKEFNTGLKRRDFSCREVVDYYLKRIQQYNHNLNAFLTITDKEAKEKADLIDKKIKQGDELGGLAGITAGLKDNLNTRGIKTTAGSKILENYCPTYSATAVEKIADAGAIILGKTNCDEFGMGASGENSAYGATKNPWDTRRVPGGSSSGSAAAVSAGLCHFALGTDTGGSVRQPAGFCNLVGLKPTYGRISRYGLIALASSLDQIGIFTRTVEDNAMVLQTIAGFDKYDSTSAKKSVPRYYDELSDETPKLKIGIPDEFFIDGMDKGLENTLKASVEKMTKLGFEVESVSLPHTPEALAVYYLILPAEASSNLARYDGIRYGLSAKDKAKKLEDIYQLTRTEGFGPEVKRRIILGTYVLSSGYYDAYYLKAQKVRSLIIKDYQKVFERVDCLLTPTSPTPAFKLGEKYEDPLTMYLSDIFTVSASIAGLPAISIPAGFSGDLPVGMQLIAPHYQESMLYQIARFYQMNTKWHKKSPAL